MTEAAALQRFLLSSYSQVAAEYYDTELHPTCASLHELSSQYLLPKLQSLSGQERILETGSGRSIVAPCWRSLGHPLDSVTLLDSSPEMLAYSAEWRSHGAHLLVADAERTDLPAGSFDIIVSSLGDPYNTGRFWSEVARLLSRDGKCYFTTPAVEWASAFRPPESRSAAEFVRADGAVPHRLVADVDAAFEQQVLDIPQAYQPVHLV